MEWYYSGKITIHAADGSWDTQEVSGCFDLPDSNVKMIRDFLYGNRGEILESKYFPKSGDAPWGDVENQAALRSELSQLMPSSRWLDGVEDKQIKSYLIAFYHHLLENIDLYVALKAKV